MAEPNVPQKLPFVIETEPGTYAWCSCGNSKNQPYCDGSHRGTDFQPIITKIEEKRNYAWCGCKHTALAPFCDGSHKNI